MAALGGVDNDEALEELIIEAGLRIIKNNLAPIANKTRISEAASGREDFPLHRPMGTVNMPPFIGLFLHILCLSTAQVLLKAAGLHLLVGGGLWLSWVLNPWLGLSFACFSLSLPCWVFILRRLPLASAYSWTALVYVLTPVAGVLLWGESLSFYYGAGIGCIICGVVIATSNARLENAT